MEEGESDSFTVAAGNLRASDNYSIRVTTNSSDIGFNNTCSDRQEDVDIPAGRTSYSMSLTLHGCDTTGGTVSATLRRGTTSIAVDSQHVTVTPWPAPPTNLEIRYHLIHADRLVVRYDDSTSPQRFYQFYIYRSNSANGVFLHQKTEQDDASPVEFSGTGIEHGKWYRAKGRTCNTQNREGCGDWSNESAAFFFDAPPTITGVAVDPDDGDRLVVDYTGATSQTGLFRFEVQYSATKDGAYNVAQTVDDALTPEVEVDGLDHSRWYQLRARSCRAGWVNCTGWSSYFDKVFLLAKPVLDVEPLPLRKAKLSWDHVDVPSTHTAEYDLEIRELGGNWPTNPTNTMTVATLDIDLDEVLPGKGLANGDYQIRVKARQKGKGGVADGMDGGYSEIITIIDNPILIGGKANGDSRPAPAGEGQALLGWDRIAGVVGGEYTIRTRKLFPSEHWDTNWSLVGYDRERPVLECVDYCLSLPDKVFRDLNPFGPTNSRLTYTREKLELGEIYGVQLNYKTTSRGVTTQVFSARDAYVWPSKGFPGDDDRPDRVATFPYFGHHADKDYGYRICRDTFFPDDTTRQDDWVDLIEHALEKWKTAADGLVTVTPEYSNAAAKEYEPCTDMSVMRLMLFIARDDDARSEIRMLDVNPLEAYLASQEIKSDSFKWCILSAKACVTSRADYSLDEDERVASNQLASVDITFNRSYFEPEPLSATSTLNPIDGKDWLYPRVPGSTRFNRCAPYQDSQDPSSPKGYLAYDTALHEAGHAIGLSNITDEWKYLVNSLTPLVDPFATDVYVASHSTIPDSVMNYDTNVPANRNSMGQFTRDEPDCSPHPFDILAIYALYQSLP